MRVKIETLWKTFNATSEWIKFADAKAGLLLAAIGIFATIFITEFVEHKTIIMQNWIVITVFLVWTIFTFLATYYSILCLNPILIKGQAESLIFFRHIANNYSTTEAFKDAVNAAYEDEQEIFDQIANQVWAISKVADNKFKMIELSIKYFVGTIFLAILNLIILLFLVVGK